MSNSQDPSNRSSRCPHQLSAGVRILDADVVTHLVTASEAGIWATPVPRAHLSLTIISNLCDLCGRLGGILPPHLHQQGVYLHIGIIALVTVLGADVGAVLVTAGPVIIGTTPVSVTFLSWTIITDIRILGADIGTLLLTACEVCISTAPVTWTHHTGAVIMIISDLDGNSVLHLLDQGDHFGVAHGLGLLCVASFCCDSQQGHKADSKS